MKSGVRSDRSAWTPTISATKLAAGIWVGPDDRWYLDLSELLAYNNNPDTPANRERIVTGARLVLSELGISVEER